MLKHSKKLRIWNLVVTSINCVLRVKIELAIEQKEKTDNH